MGMVSPKFATCGKLTEAKRATGGLDFFNPIEASTIARANIQSCTVARAIIHESTCQTCR
jgi:hypothetical protein